MSFEHASEKGVRALGRIVQEMAGFTVVVPQAECGARSGLVYRDKISLPAGKPPPEVAEIKVNKPVMRGKAMVIESDGAHP